MKKNTNFFERITAIIDYYGIRNVNEFAKDHLGYSSSEKINRLKKENTSPSFEILNDISNKFVQINNKWLLTGEGEMLISSNTSQLIQQPTIHTLDFKHHIPQVVTIDSHNQDNIVLVPQKLKAGYLQGYNDPEFIKSLPTFRMPGLNNGVFRMFEIEGNSMFPTLPNKSYVVGQFVENWITGVKDNQLYSIISNEVEDGLVKRCLNKIKKYNNLICKSDNRRNYPTQNIDPASIKEIWEVKLHLNFQLPDPADIYDRINDLEGELESLKSKIKTIN
ncbi:S24 family peptidase [Elizabethkingia anophelis]|uniref:S24 family peptidase n=1 Tax=Elizabethkingia anophelis TaxID=1117645 RepID=UPI001330515D|nr:S24/S26 family peptidase [Elizabethkingia anophelis]